jgi:hypothetical protein
MHNNTSTHDVATQKNIFRYCCTKGAKKEFGPAEPVPHRGTQISTSNLVFALRAEPAETEGTTIHAPPLASLVDPSFGYGFGFTSSSSYAEGLFGKGSPEANRDIIGRSVSSSKSTFGPCTT